MKALWRRLRLAGGLVLLLKALIGFGRHLSKIRKEKDRDAQQRMLLEALSALAKSLPYDLIEFIREEFSKRDK